MAHEAAHTKTKITPESVSCLLKWSHSSWVVQWDPAGRLDAKGNRGRTVMLGGLWHNLGMRFPRPAAGLRTSNPFPGLQRGFNWSGCCIQRHWYALQGPQRLSGGQSDVHGESDNRSNHSEEQKATIGATWASITPQQGHRLYMLLLFTNHTQTTPVRLLDRPQQFPTLPIGGSISRLFTESAPCSGTIWNLTPRRISTLASDYSFQSTYMFLITLVGDNLL